MAALPLTGRRGVIRWKYYRAADVIEYTVTAPSAGRPTWTLRGVVPPGAADSYTLKKTPLEFCATLTPGSRLTWPVLDVTIEAGRLRATLGRRES
jgi:hypothetical protein